VKVTGFRAVKPLQQWWAEAKFHAFRTWPYLLNSPTGIFLVTKTVKTERYIHCLSKGIPGQFSQIHITQGSSEDATTYSLTASDAQWTPVHNDLHLEPESSSGKDPYTIFIERASTRLYHLGDTGLMAEANKLSMHDPGYF
jgi:L-ascorbate metabolism protein UlaG (beta-lactamase superfamily)